MDKYIGKRLDGRYEIKEIIGIGGMAYVYKAYDNIDNRTVAVKILKDEYLANEEFTRRFKNESKAIAILSHPNIVKVYDVSFGDRLQYIVMEYIDGITLKEYIEQQKDIKWKEAVHFTVQILRALQHAHDKGIVHRDIKPQNIMLLADGTIKVTDFGIARFSRMDSRLTSMGDKAIGSVHYISPEQARGEITDEKADLYSVGVMLYEMLTGRLPFDADNAVSVAIMQLQSEPKMPREINEQIPEGLEEITIKAMQKDTAKRYQSAAEMLNDIDEFKRNPSIHFEYKYFIDETPTRFVETITRIKGENEEESPDNDVVDGEEEEGRKGLPVLPILAAIAGAFVLITLIFVGVFFLFKLGPSAEKTDNIEIPNLVGKNYFEDETLSSYLSIISIEPLEEYNTEYPLGYIYNQDPKPGATRKRNTSVTVYVSRGPKTIEIPEIVAGTTKEEATSLLKIRGFLDIKPIMESSNSVKEGCVIRIEPKAGEKVTSETVINMYISNGPEPLPDETVPNLVGSAQADAISALTAKGFVVKKENIKVVNDGRYNKGVVISQSPNGNTMAPYGSEVVLTVSSGFTDLKGLVVTLPDTSTPIDLKIFVAGKEVSASSVGVDSLTGILPRDKRSISLNLSVQQAVYPVTVQISVSGKNNFKDYAIYEVDGVQGKATLKNQIPFDDPAMSTGTTTGGGLLDNLFGNH